MRCRSAWKKKDRQRVFVHNSLRNGGVQPFRRLPGYPMLACTCSPPPTEPTDRKMFSEQVDGDQLGIQARKDTRLGYTQERSYRWVSLRYLLGISDAAESFLHFGLDTSEVVSNLLRALGGVLSHGCEWMSCAWEWLPLTECEWNRLG